MLAKTYYTPIRNPGSTLTILISNRTLNVVFPVLSKTSISTWPIGSGLRLRVEGSGEGALPPDLRGIGGSALGFDIWRPCWEYCRTAGLSIEERLMSGMWIHSKPVLVSLCCTCIRSRTRRISVLMAAGDSVDVVATLHAVIRRISHTYNQYNWTSLT